MRRRGVIPLHLQHIERLLELPENMCVVGLETRNNPIVIEVIVESPDLEEVPDECAAPYIFKHETRTIEWR